MWSGQGAVVRNKHGFKRSYSQLPLQTVFNSIIPAAIAGMHSRRGLDVGQRKKAQEVDRLEILAKVSVFLCCVCTVPVLTGVRSLWMQGTWMELSR